MELLPHEFGGFVSGAFLPLAIMWMFIVYLDRGAQIRSEANALHQHLQRLTYPDQTGEARVKEVTETLRRQVVDLTEASRYAVAKVEKVETLLRRQTEGLLTVAGRSGRNRTPRRPSRPWHGR